MRCHFDADDEPYPAGLGGAVHADDPGEGVAVGDGEGFVAQFGGPLDELLGMRGPAKEGEVAFATKLGVAARGRLDLA
ncbi:MAG TPA: hypothetical protein VGA18_07845 [Rhodothermales bacterium]